MKWKLAALLVVAVCLGMVANAEGGFTWLKAPTPKSIVQFKFVDFEEVANKDLSGGGAPIIPVADTAGDELCGIFRVTSIVDVNTAEDLWLPTPTQGLVGYFNKYISKAPVGMTVGLTGGQLKMFFNPNPVGVPFVSLHASNDGGAVGYGAGYDGAVNGGFSPFLDLAGVNGITGDPTVTLQSSFSVTNPPTGSGTGYLRVVNQYVPGGWFVMPDTQDPLGPGGTVGSQDMFLISDIRPGVVGWQARSEDPVLGGVDIPEPASAVVWGVLVALLVGLGLLRRK